MRRRVIFVGVLNALMPANQSDSTKPESRLLNVNRKMIVMHISVLCKMCDIPATVVRQPALEAHVVSECVHCEALGIAVPLRKSTPHIPGNGWLSYQARACSNVHDYAVYLSIWCRSLFIKLIHKNIKYVTEKNSFQELNENKSIPGRPLWVA